MNSSIVDALEKNDVMLPDARGSFTAEYQLDLSAARVEVKDFGVIHFPLTPENMQQLLKIASLAKFGLREKTLLNTAIRDTYEIPESQLTVMLDDEEMIQMLSVMHEKLGLSENTILTAHLHNLLIYTPGQFFKTHQDTEKLDGMIATLVIILPSSHIGGDLMIHHKNGKHCFSSENLHAEKLRCVAFYADCHHEVQEVKQGHRIALTYNLVLQSKNNKTKNIPIVRDENTALEQSLKAYFVDYDNAPQTMTYFLDHEYTEHSLQWEMLKGIDIKNAQALRHAAEKLNLKAHLALVEVHESWSTDSYDEEDAEPVDLIDSDTTLSFWRDKNNQLLPYEKYTVNDKEIFYTKDTEEFSPTDKEYEGYMGNYGGNVDYWYRRAAVVLWKQEHQIAMEFQLCYDIAFADLIHLIKISGNEAQVSVIVENAGDYIYRSKYRIEENDLSLFLQIAHYIQNDAVALKLLSPFQLTQLHRDLMKHLVLFQETYGLEWCLQLLQAWNTASIKASYGIPILIDYIDSLALEALHLKLNHQLMAFLLEYQIDVLLKKDKNLIKCKPVEIKQERNKTVLQSILFLKACRVFEDGASFFKKWVEHLIATLELYSPLELGEIIFTLQADINFAPLYCSDSFKVLCTYFAEILSDEIKKGLRDENDWSIDTHIKSHCEQCKTLILFLHSKTEIKKIWPIAQDYRSHISEVLRDFGLPIQISVEKKGSPHRLILEKTNQLYQMDKNRFDRLLEYDVRLKRYTSG